MKPCLAFVLGGGGARGAYQIGAVRALFEAGLTPDLLVGTSIGAANAAALALWGNDLTAVHALELAYDKAADADMLDTNLTRLAFQALSGRFDFTGGRKAAEFLITTGIYPDLTFGQLQDVRLGLIGADLNSGMPIIYGQNPQDSILDGVLASMTLPPWFEPIEREGHMIMDGGVLSNLPIEPALRLGATEIVAIDIDDPNSLPTPDNPLLTLVGRLISAVTLRQTYLEKTLAEERGVPVHYINLFDPENPTAVWDFSRRHELIRLGHEMTAEWIPTWHKRPAAATIE